MVNKEENNQQKYCHYDRGYFNKGVGQGGFREASTTPYMILIVSFKFSSIYSAYYVIVCVYHISLSIIDDFV
jgi:hypothetical protein